MSYLLIFKHAIPLKILCIAKVPILLNWASGLVYWSKKYIYNDHLEEDILNIKIASLDSIQFLT